MRRWAYGDDIRAIIDTLAHKSWPVTFGPILSEAQLAYELETHYTEALHRSAAGMPASSMPLFFCLMP
ncbi:MAG: hypothetical protein R2857_04650 [Vampirovibrionales bacterium]